MRKELNVHIGEIKLARNGEILKTILGSCVGIGIIWKKKSLCGLAHCLLPESPVKSFQISARFVDQAISSLLAMMKIRPENFSEIVVIIAGGGNMTKNNAENPEQLVGGKNMIVAKRELEKLGLKPFIIDEGGNEGRRMIIDSGECSFQIEKIPKIV